MFVNGISDEGSVERIRRRCEGMNDGLDFNDLPVLGAAERHGGPGRIIFAASVRGRDPGCGRERQA